MSLQAQLDAIKAKSAANLPAEILKRMGQAKNDLAPTIDLSRVQKEGTRMPDFNLSDAAGQIFSLAALLAEGPLVLTFYRGVW